MNLACQSSSSEVSTHGVKMSTTSCESGFAGVNNFERKEKSEALGMCFKAIYLLKKFCFHALHILYRRQCF